MTFHRPMIVYYLSRLKYRLLALFIAICTQIIVKRIPVHLSRGLLWAINHCTGSKLMQRILIFFYVKLFVVANFLFEVSMIKLQRPQIKL